MNKPVGIVVQRYGLEVNGGAEAHARMIAELLATNGYRVRVLTSEALDYHSWDPHYPAGLSNVNGVEVLRFATTPRRHKRVQEYYGRKVRERHPLQKLNRWMGRPAWFSAAFPHVQTGPADHDLWLEAQGPFMPALLTHLREKADEYSAFIFFTALYYPTAAGILEVGRKSILVPTMHDETASYFPGYRAVMAAPRYLFFNTRAEQAFSEQLFPIKEVIKKVVGVGIDLFADTITADPAVPVRLGVRLPYLLYVGRIDKSKGCDELIRFFLAAKRKTGSRLQLVMVGKNALGKVVKHPDILYTGFVSEEEKQQLMLQAAALAMPSKYESLSLVLLESFGCKVPVIANGKTEVLRDHIEQSSGGWTYRSATEFTTALKALINDPAGAQRKGEAGYDYVRAHYTWPGVLAAFEEAIAGIETHP